MSVEFVTGKLGSGKSLYALRKIQEKLWRAKKRGGNRVATNIDLHPEFLGKPSNDICSIRLPDRPRIDDLKLIGKGCEKYNEKDFGLLVLDECAHFLNSRDWNDKERKHLIDWFTMARKLHWNILFLVQDIEAIDKQVRGALCQYLVVCKDVSSAKFPILPGVRLPMPKSHMAVKYFGSNTSAFITDREFFRSAHLYKAYDTEQVFMEDMLFTEEGSTVDMRASYSQLSAWHLHGRYLPHMTIVDYLNKYLNLPYKLMMFALVHIASALTCKKPTQIARQWGVLRPDCRQP